MSLPIVPALNAIVAKGSSATASFINATLGQSGVILNAGSWTANALQGVADQSAFIQSLAAFSSKAAIRALSAAERISTAANAMAAQYGGTFAGVLGQSTSDALGTISEETIRQLQAQGWTVQTFQVCLCVDCVGAVKAAAGHLKATGIMIKPPTVNTPAPPKISINPDASKFQQQLTPVKGVKIHIPKDPDPPVTEPPVNIGLYIAIALALKNQIEAGLRTFTDVIVSGIYRGNVGHISPFYNITEQIENTPLAQPTYVSYPILDTSGNFTPPINSMTGLNPSALPHIPAREYYPNGRPLHIQERIKNTEQVVQGYFECTQYYHFLHAANIFANQLPADNVGLTHQAFLSNTFQLLASDASSYPLQLTMEYKNNSFSSVIDPITQQLKARANVLAQEISPFNNPFGYWETTLRRTEGALAESIVADNPDIDIIYDGVDTIAGSKEVFEPRPIKLVKNGFYNDEEPNTPLPNNATRWKFTPTTLVEYDHTVLFDNGYRLRMRPEINKNVRIRYMGRSKEIVTWRQKTTIIKDILSIAAAALSPATGGLSSILNAVAQVFIPDLEYDADLTTTIDTYAVQWFVPYALHYGAWTQEGAFVMSPRLDVPLCSTDIAFERNILQGRDLTSQFLPKTLMPQNTYPYGNVGIRQVYSPRNSRELSYVYPSIYNLSIDKLPDLVLSVSALTPTSFTLNWNALFSAQDYRVDVARDEDFTDFLVEARAVNGLSTTITNAVSGTRYYARVRGREDEFESDNSQTLIINVPVIPTPTALPAQAVSFDRFTANWTNVAVAEDYALDVSNSPTFGTFILKNAPVSALNSVIDALAPNTTYYYRVRARVGASFSAHSNVVSATTANFVLDAPTALPPSNVLANSITANWTNVTNAADYLFDISTAADFSSFVEQNAPTASLSRAVSSLTPNTRYYYRVRARNGAVVSAYSNVVTFLTSSDNVVITPPPPLGAPTPFASNLNVNSFQANWSNIPEATSYLLDVSTSGAFSSFILENFTTASLNRIVTGLTAGSTYYFRVRAKNALETSAYSVTASVTLPLAPPIAAPVALPATNINETNYIANWQAVPGATQYRVYAGTSPFALGFVGSTSSNSLVVSGLSPNTAYYYQVDVSAPSVSERSNIISVVTATPSLPNNLAAPTALTVTNATTNAFTASWTTVSGATDYLIDVSADSAFSSLIINNEPVSGSTRYVSALTPATTYWFRVRARNIALSLISGYSNVVAVTTASAPVIGVPTITSFYADTSTTFRISILPVVNATSYRVELSYDEAFTDILPHLELRFPPFSFENGLLTPITQYGIPQANRTIYARVRAFTPFGASAWSNIMSTWLDIMTSGTKQNSPLSAYPHSVYYLPSPPNPPYSSISTYSTTPTQITSNSARISWFPFPDTYNYNGAIVPNTPVNQIYEVSVGRARNNITWVVSDLVIDRQVVNGNFLVLTGLQPDTEYFYSVHAVGSEGNPYAKSITGSTSFGSFVHKFRTLPLAQALPPTDIGQVRFQANWATHPSATSYDLEIQRADGAFLKLYNVVGANRIVIEPPPSQTNFRYRVRIVDANNARGDWSAFENVVVRQWFEPIFSYFSSIGTNGFRLDFTRPSGAVDSRIIIRRGATVIVDIYTSAQHYIATGLTPATTYNVQVFPRNEYGEMYMNPASTPIIQSVTTLNIGVPPPNAPTLTFTSSTVNSVTVNLTDAQLDVTYSMDIARDAAFTQNVQINAYAETGSNTFFGLAPDTMYYVRARAFNGSHSPYSLIVNGRTQLAAPHLLPATEINAENARLTWETSQEVSQSLLDVARDAAFTDFVVQNEIVAAPNLTRIVAGLEEETTYWARVRIQNARGVSPYSNVREFETEADDAGVSVAMV